VFITNYIDAYELLKAGKIDALVAIGVAESVFDVFGDVVAKNFVPLIYSSAALSTRNPELAPFISVVQKALENNASRF
jgi:hypothetical protein